MPLLPAPSLAVGPTFSLFPPATGHSRSRAPLTCLKVMGRAKRSAEAVASGRGEGLEVVEGRGSATLHPPPGETERGKDSVDATLVGGSTRCLWQGRCFDPILEQRKWRRRPRPRKNDDGVD